MKRKELLQDILDQSYIMESSLSAGDFEIFEKALAAREELLKKLEQLPKEELDMEEAVLMRNVTEAHQVCVELLANMKDETEESLRQTRVELANLQRTDKAQTSYTGEEGVGTRFDETN